MVMWEIEKHEFHIVLYISHSLVLIKKVLSDMAQYPSFWGGGCPTLDFCEVLDISCTFQQFFLVNWVQTSCGELQNMIFVWLWTFH